MDLKVKIGDRIRVKPPSSGAGLIAKVVGIDVPGTLGYVVRWEGQGGHESEHGFIRSDAWEKVGPRRAGAKHKPSYASRTKTVGSAKKRGVGKRRAPRPFAMRCNCENSRCAGTHKAAACKRPAGPARVEHIGPVCDACAKLTPAKLLT